MSSTCHALFQTPGIRDEQKSQYLALMRHIFSHKKDGQEVQNKSYIIHNIISGRVLIIEYSLIDDSLSIHWALYFNHDKLM